MYSPSVPAWLPIQKFGQKLVDMNTSSPKTRSLRADQGATAAKMIAVVTPAVRIAGRDVRGDRRIAAMARAAGIRSAIGRT